MKKFKTQKLTKTDIYVRYLIGAILTIFVLKFGITGFPFYFILTFTALLVFTGVVEKSWLKTKLYPIQTKENNNKE